MKQTLINATDRFCASKQSKPFYDKMSWLFRAFSCCHGIHKLTYKSANPATKNTVNTAFIFRSYAANIRPNIPEGNFRKRQHSF